MPDYADALLAFESAIMVSYGRILTRKEKMNKLLLAIGAAAVCGTTFSGSPSCSASATSGRLVIAERGCAAQYSIVVPGKASPAQRYAAEELRDWTEKVTGVKLPVIVGSGGAPVAGVLPAKAITLEVASPKPDGEDLADGFRLKVDGDRLRIIGENARGTLYGAYEILERFAGCRWYASWHSFAPRRERIEVPANLDETSIPAFAMREPYWYDVMQHPEFAARLRVNSRSWRGMEEKFGGDPYRFGGGLGSCHTFEKLLPPKEYFDTHPEYFSLVKGRRLRDHSQLCLTNPDVLRIVTSNVLDRIRKDPGAKFYGVSQNDCYNFCECPACKAVDDEEGSHAGTMIRFVNAIAEAVEKEFPRATIETLAYQYTRKAPTKTKLRHNVVPCLCTIECDFALPLDKSPFKENVAFRKDIEDWSRMTDFLYIWDYTTDFANYPMPWPNVYALQGNLQFFRRNKVKAMFAQGAYQGRHADFAELKGWLLAKWMWNPDLPMKPLLDDFFAGYYGKAAPFVRDYFEAIHKMQIHCSSSQNKPLLIFDSVGSSVLQDGFLDFAAGCWQQAVDAVKDDPATSYNVRMAKFSFDYLRLEKSNCLLYLRKSKPSVSQEESKRLAQSLLDRMDEAKDIRLAEGDRTEIVEKWKNIAKEGIAQSQSASGEIEDRLIPVSSRGKWGDYVDDPKAEDGRALKLFNTHFNWCAMLSMGRIAFEPGRKYRLSVRVRTEKAGDGEAFWTGVYSKAALRGRGGIEPRTADIPDGEYHWYDVLTWTPSPDEYFWMGPGRFNADGKSAIGAVYLDKIRFTAADDPN